jgi:hypothetical protein
MTYIMLLPMLYISEYMWIMFSYYSNFYPFLYFEFLLRLHKQWLMHQEWNTYHSLRNQAT